ncbi:MAG TPA: hypothetical protein VGP13_01085 [Candidatus Paceibacterota bacterium]|jgi:hypothetical protein|nr:hypothetical protein [Candidatus Paceibacterota bacterium]
MSARSGFKALAIEADEQRYAAEQAKARVAPSKKGDRGVVGGEGADVVSFRDRILGENNQND